MSSHTMERAQHLSKYLNKWIWIFQTLHESLNAISHKFFAYNVILHQFVKISKVGGAIITPQPDDAIQPKSDADDGISHPTLHWGERERDGSKYITPALLRPHPIQNHHFALTQIQTLIFNIQLFGPVVWHNINHLGMDVAPGGWMGNVWMGGIRMALCIEHLRVLIMQCSEKSSFQRNEIIHMYKWSSSSLVW